MLSGIRREQVPLIDTSNFVRIVRLSSLTDRPFLLFGEINFGATLLLVHARC